ncbi:MAG: hypothetical protein AAFX99_32720, partial [Myxococcota bacterium]
MGFRGDGHVMVCCSRLHFGPLRMMDVCEDEECVMRWLWSGVGMLVVMGWAVSPVWACGGLFCAVPQGPAVAPEPVDQNAERIVFEVDEDEGTITAHVQIQAKLSGLPAYWICT